MQTERPLAFSYIRFSTPQQALGDSERRQIAMAEAYADKHGLELDCNTFTDVGVSAFRGKNYKEGALRALLEMARDGDIATDSVLIVESMDRLSRTVPRRAIRILEDLCDYGLTVVTLDNGHRYTRQSLDNEPYAFLFAYLVAIRANEESARKGMRVAAAWADKRKRATSEKLTSMCPGWLRLRQDRSAYEVIPGRVEVVRRVFKEALEGVGQERIAKRLNIEGVATFGDGMHWYKGTVGKIMRNQAAVGRYQPKMMVQDGSGFRRSIPDGPVIEGYYPPVISVEDFSALALRIAERYAKYVQPCRVITNPLASLARCSVCKGTMTQLSKSDGQRPRLVCARARFAGDCRHASLLLDEVWETLRHPILIKFARDADGGSNAMQRRLRFLADALGGRDVTAPDLNVLFRQTLSCAVIDLPSDRSLSNGTMTFQWLSGDETSAPLPSRAVDRSRRSDSAGAQS